MKLNKRELWKQGNREKRLSLEHAELRESLTLHMSEERVELMSEQIGRKIRKLKCKIETIKGREG